MGLSEQEEFEFRHRLEQERAQQRRAEPPSMLAVAGNAAMKGLASIPDAVLNTPANLGNLAMMAYATGRPEAAARAELFRQPNLVQGAMRKAGLISESNEPQTAGQRILDTGIQAGINTAIAPASGLGQVARNMGVGLTSGAAAGATKEATGSDLAAFAVGALTPLAIRAASTSWGNPKLPNEVKMQTLKEGHEAGYVVPPSSVKPTFTANRVESIAGKAAVKQEAALRNQQVTNRLALKAMDSEKFGVKLPEDTPITEGLLESVRKKASAPYEQIAKISPQASNALDALEQTRFQSKLAWTEYQKNGSRQAYNEAQSFDQRASLLERVIEKTATRSGQPGLVQDLKDARKLKAITHDIERALNLGDGNVDARMIGRMLDQGKPLSGNLRVIGKFAQAFPAVTRESAMVPASGVSGTDAAASAFLGMGGYGAVGDARGLMAAGLPLVRGPARSIALSSMYQNRLLPKEPPKLTNAYLQSLLAGRSVAAGD